MEKIKLIVNPSSGRQNVDRKIDQLIKLLLNSGYIIGRFNTEKKHDAMNETIKTCKEDWDMIIVSGGDGTVNEVAKGIAYSDNKLPVAILSSGTVNDFANYMKMPKNIPDFFEMIERKNIIDVDLGKVNDNYFVNVAAAGLLTSVGHQVPAESKLILGRTAYYLEGLRELVLEELEPINIKFESEEYNEEGEILLFIVSNSSSIGGFKKLAPEADVHDGLLDVVIIKDSDVPELANIFLNVLTGEHINHPNVRYFKTKRLNVTTNQDVPIDIDGEYGGKLPAIFQAIPNGMKIFTWYKKGEQNNGF